jgi:3-dehydroquinate synthase
MQKSFDIISSSGRYKVTVGNDLLNERLHCSKNDVCMVDARLAHLVPNDIITIVSVSANEQSKSLEALSPIIKLMRQNGADRSSRVIAIGGGVIQDIATIVASLYMRGIIWEYLPTTLLGMVDSCIGGKSSINIDGYKNLVGNIYPPEQINIDVNFLDTLGTEQIIDGLCEAVKICYAKSAEELDRYLRLTSTIEESLKNIESVIMQCLKAKQWFIEIDEFDQNERLLLNFGHTFGHALESATEFQISHGVAVGIGMVVAEEYARQQSLLSPAGAQRSARLTSYVEGLVKCLPQLAAQFHTLDYDSIALKFANDKKHKTDQYRIILPQGDGDLSITSVPRTEQGRSDILAAYRATAERLVKLY